MIDVKILGTGCRKCEKLYKLAEQAMADTGVEGMLSKVEDMDEIMTYRIMMTPGLVVNGEVKSTGKLPKMSQIVGWLTEAKTAAN